MTPERAEGLKLANYRLEPDTDRFLTREQIETVCQELRASEAEHAAKDGALANAPHAKSCQSLVSGYFPGEIGFRQRGFPFACDCWKSKLPAPQPCMTCAAKDGEIRRLREVLTKHHQWHLEIGTVMFPPSPNPNGNDDPVEVDLTDAYSDSSMCEETISALAPASQPSGISGELPCELCICAAIRMPDGEIIRGHRHNHCYDVVRQRANAKENRENICQAKQGFFTTRNRFVDRQEGMRIQRTSGLPSSQWGDGEYRGDYLFSEDLYADNIAVDASATQAGPKHVEDEFGCLAHSQKNCMLCALGKALGKNPKQGEPGWLADEVL
jgi:hypothetical protein